MKQLVVALRRPSLVSLVAATIGAPSATHAQSLAPVDRIAYISSGSDPSLVLIDPDGSNRTSLATGYAWDLAWSPDGTRLAFTRGSHLMVVPADGGTAVALVNWGDYLDGAAPAWSPDGTKIAFTNGGRIFVVAVLDGSIVALTDGREPAWSPDGAKIAFPSRVDGELYVINADGSSPTRLTPGVYAGGRASWSPDGAHIVFRCIVDWAYPQSDVCAIGADGLGFVQLTTDPGDDSAPAWSPDGARIVFSTTRYGDWTNCPDDHSTQVAVMNADGSGVSQVGGTSDGVVGRPTWSPDGTRIAFTNAWILFIDYGNGAGYSCSSLASVYVVNADATNLVWLDSGFGAAWRPAATGGDVNAPPAASFVSTCGGLTCSFDASGSSDADGTIASHEWQFGDGAGGSGPTVTHAYESWGSYAITLTVTDDAGASDVATSTVTANATPIASFTAACTSLTCNFDGSGSSDPDGTIATYVWNFGDGNAGSGPAVDHVYPSAASYTITLTVTDNVGATAITAHGVTVARPSMHVGDLDGATQKQPGTWKVMLTITVHDSSHNPAANATVSGTWSAGETAVCTTGSNGQCATVTSAIPNKTTSMTFTIGTVVHAAFVDQPADNHDPDGDSDGVRILVRRP